MPRTLSDDELQRVYAWIDEIPLSRPKRNINRDFSDGVLMAEVVAHYFPRLVELHNYSQANSVRKKMYNWSTMNVKVFKRMGFQIDNDSVSEVVNCKPGAIEAVLMTVQEKMAAYRARRGKKRSGANTNRSSGDRSGGAPRTGRSAPGSEPKGRAAPTARGPAVHAGGAAAGAGSAGHRNAPDPSRAFFPAASAAHDALASNEGKAELRSAVDEEILIEKEQTIQELNETVEILELKVKKLEQLVRLKDNRIQTLTARLKSKNFGGE